MALFFPKTITFASQLTINQLIVVRKKFRKKITEFKNS